MIQPQTSAQKTDSAIHAGFGDLAAALRQLHAALRRGETEGEVAIAEPQIANQLLRASSRLEPIEEYKRAEEELLSPAFLSLIDVIASIGELAERNERVRFNPEYLRRVVKSLGNVEDRGADILKVLLAESADASRQEQLKGVLRKLVEAIQEKKLLIVRRGEINPRPKQE